MRLEEAIDFVAGLEAKQLPQVRPGQTPGAISLGGQRFERLPCEVGAIGGETGGNVVRKGDGYVHHRSLTEWERAVKSPMIKHIIMGGNPVEGGRGASKMAGQRRGARKDKVRLSALSSGNNFVRLAIGIPGFRTPEA